MFCRNGIIPLLHKLIAKIPCYFFAAPKKELLNARMRLDSKGFDDEIELLNRYIEVLGQELHLAE